jgi:hypothetical protein
MRYEFNYFYDRYGEEKTIDIYAENDIDAVMEFYSKVGIAEFGCIKDNGDFFTDEKYPNEKHKIISGC